MPEGALPVKVHKLRLKEFQCTRCGQAFPSLLVAALEPCTSDPSNGRNGHGQRDPGPAGPTRHRHS
jgi:hypothetical protein